MSKEIEDKTKNGVACMALGKNLNYQIPKNNFGNTNGNGSKNPNQFFPKIKSQQTKRRTPNTNRYR